MHAYGEVGTREGDLKLIAKGLALLCVLSGSFSVAETSSQSERREVLVEQWPCLANLFQVILWGAGVMLAKGGVLSIFLWLIVPVLIAFIFNGLMAIF